MFHQDFKSNITSNNMNQTNQTCYLNIYLLTNKICLQIIGLEININKASQLLEYYKQLTKQLNNKVKLSLNGKAENNKYIYNIILEY